MTKHKILAGSTAPWLRTALTRVQDRLADDVAEQIKNMGVVARCSNLYVIVPPAVADAVGIERDASKRQLIHSLPVYLSPHVGAPVVVTEGFLRGSGAQDYYMNDGATRHD